jgi:signal transduction histidine kinase
MRIPLDSIDLKDMALLGEGVRSCAEGAASMEEAAQRVVEKLDALIGKPDGDGAGLVLSRLYVTRRFGRLDRERAEFAQRLAGVELGEFTPCLTLMGTYGREAEWCEARRSLGHMAIPLLSLESVEGLPMVWRLLHQMGVDIGALLRNELRMDGLDVFHIEKAEGSRWIPAQEFVKAHGVESALAVGAVLPDGELMVLLLFTRVRVNSDLARILRPLSLSAELALLPSVEMEEAVRQEAKIVAYQRLLSLKDAIVADRVGALRDAMRELELASGRAEEQTKLRDELLRNVRHELRTPMNGVFGMLEMLKHSATLSVEDRRFVDIAWGAAGGLMHVLENLVEYSDLVTKRREATKRPVDLRRLLESMMQPMREQGQALEWKLGVSEDCPDRIVADEDGLRGVMQQLLENALKFTHQGRVEVEAGIQRNLLVLVVKDTGIGVAEEEMPRLFEPFVQVDGSNRRRYGGTGMGLAIVAKLVERMEGSVCIESEVGKGSSFMVSVPLQG